MILSLKAGGTGLNLTAATNVIHYDLWWNPAVEDQATDRTYRIGQDKNVMVHRFITLGTFEEKIDEMINNKKDLANVAVFEGEKIITKALRRRNLQNLLTWRLIQLHAKHLQGGLFQYALVQFFQVPAVCLRYLPGHLCPAQQTLSLMFCS